MDSPRISNREAWGLILKVAAINIVLTPVIFAVGFSIFGGNLNEIANYKNYHQAFVLPWNKFHVFLSDDNLKVALTEEFLYRFPALLLMHVLVLTGHKLKKYDFE